MAKKKLKITTEDIRKIEKGVLRDEMKDQGALDGRYRPRVVKSKKAYKRKPKNDNGSDL